MRSRAGLTVLCCAAALATGGCFSATGPRTIVAISDSPGQGEVLRTPIIVFYSASKFGTYGGHLTDTKVRYADVRFYVGPSPLTVRPPEHVGFDPVFLPGTYWSGVARVIAPGYELALSACESSTAGRTVYRLTALDGKTIRLRAIEKIACIEYELGAFDVNDGVNPQAKREFCRCAVEFYQTWQRRWGDPGVRQQYCQREHGDRADSVAYDVDQMLRKAEIVIAKIKKCSRQPGARASEKEPGG